MAVLKYLDVATGTYKPLYLPTLAVGSGLTGDGSSAAPLKIGPDTGWLDMTGWASGWTASGGLGGPSMFQARQIGNKVELRGNVVNGTFTGTNVTICTLNSGIDPPLQTSGFTIVGAAVVRWGSVLASGAVQVTSGTAAGGWWQIVGSYLID